MMNLNQLIPRLFPKPETLLTRLSNISEYVNDSRCLKACEVFAANCSSTCSM